MFVRALWFLLLLSVSASVVVAAAAESPPEAHYDAGIKAFAARDYATAARELAASMRVRPDAKTALYLGNAYLKFEQLSQAKEAFEQVLKIDPRTSKRNDILKLIKNIDSRNVGFVKCATSPAGATVFLYGQGNRAHGKTPLKLTLPVGAHRVVLKAESYETVAQDVTVPLGETVTIELALRPAVCELVLSSTPAGSQADVDGTGPVKAPAKVRVGRGPHRVKFTAQGFLPQEISVDCEGGKPGDKVEVNVQLGRPKRRRLGATVPPPGGAPHSAGPP